MSITIAHTTVMHSDKEQVDLSALYMTINMNTGEDRTAEYSEHLLYYAQNETMTSRKVKIGILFRSRNMVNNITRRPLFVSFPSQFQTLELRLFRCHYIRATSTPPTWPQSLLEDSPVKATGSDVEQLLICHFSQFIDCILFTRLGI